MAMTVAEAARRVGIRPGSASQRIYKARSRGEEIPGLRQISTRVTGAGKYDCTEEFLDWLAEGAAVIRPGPGLEVTGLTLADVYPDPEAVWQKAEALYEHAARREELRADQRVVINDPLPFLFVQEADWHLGANGINYPELHRHVELVAATPYCYVGLYGDLHENSISESVRHLPWNEDLTMKDQFALFRWCVQKLVDSGRLIVATSGTHEQRTYLTCGLDMLALLFPSKITLYDAHEVTFDLALAGEAAVRFKVRHDWKGRSQWNPTHPMERDAALGDGDWDVAVGGHAHNMTVCREFVRQKKLRRAIQLASYKLDDSYPRSLNMPPPPAGHLGSYSLLVYPDGTMQGFRELKTAVRFCEWERGRWGQ